MGSRHHHNQDKESTLYVGNLDERCTDEQVWELMLQMGPVVNVHLPKERVSRQHQGYGFVEFASEEDADYAAKIMNQIRVWGKPIRVNKASADKRGGIGGNEGSGLGGGHGVGAELFVGNLDMMVDEKVLYETFSRFGPLIAPPKVARDESNLSKGYGFVSYADFEASDDAIANLHGQYLMNKEIVVQYAYKKDGKGERHGDAAERALAEQAKKHGVQVEIPAMPASLVMPTNTPNGPASVMNGYPPVMMPPTAARVPQPPPTYSHSTYGSYTQAPPPITSYNYAPPPQTPYQPGPANYQNSFNRAPLQAPPAGAGLPARPPPSMVGYGGPVPPHGFPPQASPPVALPPPGFQPPPPPSHFPPAAPNVPGGYQQR